jgi:PBSX family phage portal protein
MSRQPFCYVTKQGKTVRPDQLDQFALKEAESKQLEDPFAETDYTKGIVKPPTDPGAMIRVLDMNTYHAKACQVKARDVAGVGWSISPASGVETEDTTDSAARKQILEDFFEKVEITKQLVQAQHDFEAVGWGAIEIARGAASGLPVKLFQIPSESIRVHKDRNRFMQKVGNKKVWFKAAGYEKDIDYKTGIEAERGELEEKRRANEILFWTNYKPGDRYYGKSDVVPALGAILGDVSRRDYNISFFDNYGVPAYAVFITGDFDPGEPEEEGGPTPLEESIEQHFQEVAKNPHSVLVLSVPSVLGENLGDDGSNGGRVEVKIEPLSVQVKEASFRMYRQDNRDEVLTAHGVDPYRVGIAETGSLGGTTADQASEVYKESVLEPRQTMLERIINVRIVVEMFGITDWEFKLDVLDSSDPVQDLQILTGLFAMGAVTPLQIARHYEHKFGLDLEGMDHPALKAHYVGGQPVDLEMPEVETDAGAINAAVNAVHANLTGLIAKKSQNGGVTQRDLDDLRMEMLSWTEQ